MQTSRDGLARTLRIFDHNTQCAIVDHSESMIHWMYAHWSKYQAMTEVVAVVQVYAVYTMYHTILRAHLAL